MLVSSVPPFFSSYVEKIILCITDQYLGSTVHPLTENKQLKQKKTPRFYQDFNTSRTASSSKRVLFVHQKHNNETQFVLIFCCILLLSSKPLAFLSFQIVHQISSSSSSLLQSQLPPN